MADITVSVDGGSETVIVKALERLCSSASAMLPPFTKRLGELVKWSQEIDRIGRVGEGLTPDVCMVLQDLKVFLSLVKGKGVQYVQAARDTASFVCESGIIEEVEQDLKNQSTEDLFEFLVDMEEYINKCEARLRDFEAIESTFKRDVTEKLEYWERKRKEADEREASYCGLSLGMNAVGELLAKLGPEMVKASASSAIASHAGGRATIAVAVTGVTICAAGYVANSLAAVFAIEKGISEQHKAVFVEALRQAMLFNEARTDVLVNVQNMKLNLETVKRYVDGKDGDFRGLKDAAYNPVYREKRGHCVLREYHKINTNLKALEGCMKKVLEEANKCIQ